MARVPSRCRCRRRGSSAIRPAPPRDAKDDALYHVELTSTVDPTARIEVLIDKKPAWSNIVTGLELDRRTRWGELYTLDDSSVRSIAGHDWLRTAYRYAHVADKGDVPRVDRALEYATIDREQIYVVTLFGTPARDRAASRTSSRRRCACATADRPAARAADQPPSASARIPTRSRARSTRR